MSTFSPVTQAGYGPIMSAMHDLFTRQELLRTKMPELREEQAKGRRPHMTFAQKGE